MEKSVVYFTLEYCKAVEKIEKGKALLAIFENELGKIVYPFILRKIACQLNDTDIFDIVTPYGYGGPYIEGDRDNIKNFRKMFEIYCQEQNIVTEDIRFHPFLENHLPMEDYINLQYILKTTAVNLEGDLEYIRLKYKKMNKRNIKQAKKMAYFVLRLKRMK